MREHCIGELLRRRAALEPELVATIQADMRITYSTLNQRANAAANFLLANGVQRGDRVSVLGRNSTSYVELYFACAKIGAVICGLNVRLATDEIEANLADSGATILFSDSEFAKTTNQLRDRLGLSAFSMRTSCGGFDSYEEHRDRSPSDEPMVDVASNLPLVLVYTSGTTGKSKGAVLTQEQMYWASATQIHSLDYRHRDVNLIAAPLFHVGGLALLTLAIHLGQTALLLDQWDIKTVLKLIQQEKVNHFFAVPTMLKGLLDALPTSNGDLNSLRWIVSGGAPTPKELIHALAAHGISVLQSYGATETGGPAACVGLNSAVAKAGTVGRPYFNTEIRIVDPSGSPSPAGEVGEIQIRGPHVFAGYWNNPEATKVAFDEDWLRTGDLGSMDDQGDITIVGRAKDMIITGGENVYPAEVEAVLQTHPAIADTIVVGVPDRTWGEILCAVIVLHPGKKFALDDLNAHCRGKIAGYKIPRVLKQRIKPLPRNASGKVLRQEILLELADIALQSRS